VDLPALPMVPVFTKFVGDTSLEGGMVNRTIDLQFRLNATDGPNGTSVFPPLPTLLSWSFLKQTCPESTVGYEASPGKPSGQQEFGVDATNRNSAVGLGG